MGSVTGSDQEEGQRSAPSLTAVILTRDEERHMTRAIGSLDGLASRIVVIDSGSRDATREIARAHGAEVFERAWVNYADQFQWALDNCGIDTDWTMRLDADEWLGPELIERLVRSLPTLPATTGGVSLDRRHIFLGKWIRFGGRYPLRLLRIWRTGNAHIEQRWMDEHMVLEKGDIAHVEGTFADENLGDLGFFTAKHNAYATREAVDALLGEMDASHGAMEGSTAQAKRKRSIKTRLYNRLPLGVGPLAYFLWRYIAQLGFLDGRAGLIYHVLQGFWYRFLVDAKRYELKRALRACEDREARLDRLAELTGLDIHGFAQGRLSDER